MINTKVSILIANYNNEEYIEDCINSLINQSYKNIEIIFFDDCSLDNSISKIKKFSDVKIIKNEKKNKRLFGSFNQRNAYQTAFYESSGDIIFFLDSDDYFAREKIESVVKKFHENENTKIIFDLPIYKFNNKTIKKVFKKKIIDNYWPFIPPQSCISVRRKHFKKLFEKINFDLFPNIWIDFRICIYSKFILKQFVVLEKNLTFYRTTENNVSSNFKYLSQSWWRRRLEAHKYIRYFFDKYKIYYKKNFDFIITTIINKIL